MKVLIFKDLLECSDFYTKVSVIDNADSGESIAVILENNNGGATHLGGVLINSIKSSDASITLTIDGMVASTAAFVWTWIHLAKFHGYFKNVKTTFKNNKAHLIYHRPRKIDDEGERFMEHLSNSEVTESFVKYVDSFERSFVGLLSRYPLAKVFSLDNDSILLGIEEAYNSYASNKDVVVYLDDIVIAETA